MPWQPMPPPATEPSGTTVERLCGHPEQKYGVRAGRSASTDDGDARARRPQARRVEVLLQPAPQRRGDDGDVEHAAGGDERARRRVALAV